MGASEPDGQPDNKGPPPVGAGGAVTINTYVPRDCVQDETELMPGKMISKKVKEEKGKGEVPSPRVDPHAGKTSRRDHGPPPVAHVYGSPMSCVPAPRQEIPNEPIPPSLAKQIIIDVRASQPS